MLSFSISDLCVTKAAGGKIRGRVLLSVSVFAFDFPRSPALESDLGSIKTNREPSISSCAIQSISPVLLLIMEHV
jgi:hypothetical protein